MANSQTCIGTGKLQQRQYLQFTPGQSNIIEQYELKAASWPDNIRELFITKRLILPNSPIIIVKFSGLQSLYKSEMLTIVQIASDWK